MFRFNSNDIDSDYGNGRYVLPSGVIYRFVTRWNTALQQYQVISLQRFVAATRKRSAYYRVVSAYSPQFAAISQEIIEKIHEPDNATTAKA
jgi:hypothetical protein